MAVTIRGDDAKLVALIQALANRLEQQGARFHKGISIAVDNGNLSIFRTDSLTAEDVCFSVPVALMPSVSDFDITVDNDYLVATPKEGRVSCQRDVIMKLLIDIYNCAGKVQQWRKTFPFLALCNHPEILALFKAGFRRPELNHYREFLDNGQTDKLMVESFLGSRMFKLGEIHRKCERLSEKQSYVLLPMIDFLNHHYAAYPYCFNEDDHKPSMQIHPKAGLPGDELFVRYSLGLDAVNTYLIYGYVDESAPWLPSIATQISLDDGYIIQIEGAGDVVQGKLPPNSQNLRIFLPRVVKKSANHIKLNKLIIPDPRSPRSLRRILSGIIHSSNTGWSDNLIQEQVLNAENQLLESNQSYWQHMQTMTSSIKDEGPRLMLQQLCQYSLSHLKTYREVTAGF